MTCANLHELVRKVPYCRQCGAELPKDANFCPVCGTPTTPEVKPIEKHQVLKVKGRPKLIVTNVAPGSVNVKSGADGEVAVDFDLRLPEHLDCSVSQNGNVVTVNCRGKAGFRGWPAYVWGSGPMANIIVSVPAESDLDLENRVGNISVTGAKGTIEAESSAGRVQILNCNGTVRVRTRAGSVDFENVEGTVSARSSAGAIKFSGALSKGENWFRTSVGSIDLSLEGPSDLTVEASAILGSISVTPELADAYRRRSQYSGRIGAGTGRLIVETKTGSITIHH